ncbi:MAG TPA: ABC transporter substrate-binding protein [Candidatus Elarobacter sp.]|jgi:polar amino acid transport system substrate-binding protein|nr:ABC transporter substrate-binding protein [Candidatus Elarobacter sp.]
MSTLGWVRNLCAALAFLGTFAVAGADQSTMDVAKIIAPSGHLRAAINYGNPVLAQKDPQTGEPRGVSADLARELGRRLGVPVDFVTYDAAGKVTDALRNGDAWDVAFLAIDPVRSAGITFTAPYVLIEGAYLVPDSSPIRSNDDVDRAGVRVSVGRGSAYDLFLTRTLKNAQLVRVPTSPDALATFERDHLEVAAGVKQPVIAYAAAHPGLRVLPGRFMVIEQAVGIPKAHEAALPYVRAFVEEMKASGFVAKALAASGRSDATVAPAAP